MNGFGIYLKDYLDFYKISQTDFADRLGISVKHLNEILNGNTGISEELILAISLVTDIDIKFILFVENKKKMYEYLYSNYKDDKGIKKFLDSYYLKELEKRNWLVLKDCQSLTQCSIDLLEFLQISNFDNLDRYIDKRILFKKRDDADLKKVYLWIKRCDKLILNQEVSVYSRDKLFALLDKLKLERNNKFNINNLIKIFNDHGIYLVIEDALSGTKVRGCMMVKGRNPSIYMTKYLKEKSSFYYALYHELGHVKSDFNRAKSKIIVDDDCEDNADIFAVNQMIPDDVWLEIKNNYVEKEKICEKYKIPLCFLYSRLAYEKVIDYSSKEYQSHREIIG